MRDDPSHRHVGGHRGGHLATENSCRPYGACRHGRRGVGHRLCGRDDGGHRHAGGAIGDVRHDRNDPIAGGSGRYRGTGSFSHDRGHNEIVRHHHRRGNVDLLAADRRRGRPRATRGHRRHARRESRSHRDGRARRRMRGGGRTRGGAGWTKWGRGRLWDLQGTCDYYSGRGGNRERHEPFGIELTGRKAVMDRWKKEAERGRLGKVKGMQNFGIRHE